MSWQVWVAVVLVGGPFAYYVGSIAGTLRAIHKELVRIRLATVSLHDKVVPEVLMTQMERKMRR